MSSSAAILPIPLLPGGQGRVERREAAGAIARMWTVIGCLRQSSRRAIAEKGTFEFCSVAAVDKAMAAAVRRQLTKPGSITPQRQLHLVMADRAAHDLPRAGVPVVVEFCWTPFRDNVAVRSARRASGNSNLSADNSPVVNWWDRMDEALEDRVGSGAAVVFRRAVEL